MGASYNFLVSSILKTLIRRALQPKNLFTNFHVRRVSHFYSNSAPKHYNYPAYLFSVAQHPVSRLLNSRDLYGGRSGALSQFAEHMGSNLYL